MKKLTSLLFIIFGLAAIGDAQSGRRIKSNAPIPESTPQVRVTQDASDAAADAPVTGYSESAPNAPRSISPNLKRDKKSKKDAKKESNAPTSPTVDAAKTGDAADEDVVKVETNLITMPVSVYDRNGLYIPNLEEHNFEIYEDGVKQEIAYFGTSDKPFSVVLLIDVSPSTAYKIEEIQSAAAAFVAQLKPQDNVMVISFDESVHVLTEMTADRDKINKAIRRTSFGEATSLYEAVDFTLKKRLDKIDGRKAIVLFTDGVDTSSIRSSFESTVQEAEESEAMIFPIYYNTFLQSIGIQGGIMSAPPILNLPRSNGQGAEYARGKAYLARRVRRDQFRRHAREPCARRADHEGSAELPHGVNGAPRPTGSSADPPRGCAGRLGAARRSARNERMTTSTTNPAANSPRQAAMPFIMVVVLIDMLAIGLMIPVLPPLVGLFTGSTADQAYWYGVVTFTFSLANFLSSPTLGGLSDRFGRRPMLLLSFAALALSFFVTAMASALWMLILVRVFSGAMQSNASVANAYVADITAPEDRAKRFGQLGAMFGIGFILGPVMGGLLGAINLQLPFFVAGGLALVNLAYGWFVLPESLAPEKRHAFSWRRANPITALREMKQLKGVGLLVVVIACSGLAQFMLYTVWVLYTSLKFGWGPLENGWSLFAVGVTSALVQGVLLGRLLKRYSPQRLAMVGMASSAAAYLLYGLATEGWMMVAIVVANLLGFTAAASIQSIVSGAADARTQGRTMGAVSSLNMLTAVVAPALAAPLLGAVSHLPRDDWRIGAPFYLCALLQAVALIVAWVHFRGARRARLAAASAS